MAPLAAADGSAPAQLARHCAGCRRRRRGSSRAGRSRAGRDGRSLSIAWPRRRVGGVGRGGRHSADPTARGLFGMTAVTFGFPAPGMFGPSHATIGTFDGIHRGHQALLKTLIGGARGGGGPPVVVTLPPPPPRVLRPDPRPPHLTTPHQNTCSLGPP